MIKIKLEGEDYDNAKRDIIENKTIIPFVVNSKDIEISTLDAIFIKKTLFNLDKKALSSLTKSLGMTKMVMDTLKSTFGAENNVLKLIITSIKQSKAKELVLLYNKETKSITHVYKKGEKLITDNQYFDTLEAVIEKTPGAFLRSLDQLDNGDLIATIANPQLEFQFSDYKEEIFTAGMTLALTTKKMYTSFFTERLWCSNGMVTTDKLCTVEVAVRKDVPEFMAAILDSDYHIDSITEFKRRLNRCYKTTASLNEVLTTERRMKRILGEGADSESLLSTMSANALIQEFGYEYMEQKDKHTFLYTDMTLWDLVNEVTAISSQIEQKGMNISENQNLEIQMLGGDCMFNIPDLPPNNIKQKFNKKGERINRRKG